VFIPVSVGHQRPHGQGGRSLSDGPNDPL